ncbi:MAG: hypothetical protein P1V35_08140 [Planctomycetota bacterium]|nr:hypothetical protein [Planctomycetota bacterium]
METTPVPPGVFHDVLTAPDRVWTPGANPVLSVHGDEDPQEIEAIQPWIRETVRLQRRGVDHGDWLVLNPEAAPAREDHPPEALLDERWYEARPILLPGFLKEPEDEAFALERFRTLSGDKGLRAFLTDHIPRLGETFAPGSNMHLHEAHRDLERIKLGGDHDLWVKLGRLSSHKKDASLRVRFSFGKEGPDDASRDIERHRLVREVAELLLPDARGLTTDPWLSEHLQRWVGGPVLPTQHIAYFNAPNGGALWHHDGFNEPLEGGQRGVLYTQVAGRTAWLALSIDELCHLVREFLEYMTEGDLPWVRERIAPKPAAFDRLVALAKRFPRLRRELGRPGGGELSGLIHAAPEFTALCADAGHAFLLGPGDGLLMPNHGLEKTVMHTVFCASPGPTYAISTALREDAEYPELSAMRGASAERARGGRNRGARRSRRRR